MQGKKSAGALSKARPATRAETEVLRAHNAQMRQRQQAIKAILRRPERERLTVEAFEWLIDQGVRGILTDDRATAILEGIRRADAVKLRAAGGDRLPPPPIRAIAGGRA